MASTEHRPATWRVGNHYGIHVYEGDRPVATFHSAEDARRAVAAVNGDAFPPSFNDAARVVMQTIRAWGWHRLLVEKGGHVQELAESPRG